MTWLSLPVPHIAWVIARVSAGNLGKVWAGGAHCDLHPLPAALTHTACPSLPTRGSCAGTSCLESCASLAPNLRT